MSIPSKPSASSVSGLVLGAVVVCLIALRAASEWGMMSAFGSDPQMGIWMMFMGVKLLFWAGVALVCAMVAALVRGRWTTYVRYGILSCWAAAICFSAWNYLAGWRALADAANPSTSPDRLRHLARFDGIQAGYELDNRIASNPNAPDDVLRLLATKDQLGTKMCLARNPRTPKDVLDALSRNGDEGIQKGLKDNPNFAP